MVRTATVLAWSLLAALAMIWMLFGSLMILDPSSTDWMAYGDLASYHVCSIFFAEDAWRWPPGLNPDYGAGFDASIAQCTPSFLFSLGDKLLTTLGVLAPTGQHHGYVVLTNLVLQFVAAFLIFRHLLGASRPLASLLIALLFTQMPELLVRNTGHLDLGAHYLLLFGMLAILAGRAHLHLWFTLLMLLAILTHTYLFAMVFGLYCLGVALELARVRPTMEGRAWLRQLGVSVAILAGAVALVVVLFYALTGIASDTSIGASGYGLYRSDLLTFIDANGSVFLGDLPSDAGEYKGSFYLGIGFVAILGISVAALVASRGRRAIFSECTLNWKLIAAFCLVTTLFATSNRLSLGPWELVIPSDAWEDIGALFRSSGRFIWLPGYILCIAATFAVARLLPGRWLIAVLVALNAVQLVEGWARPGANLALAWSTRYVQPMEAIARADIEGLRTMQPGFAPPESPFFEYAHPAAVLGLSLDQYYLGRADAARAAELGRERIMALLRSDFDTGFAYLIPIDDENLLGTLDGGADLFTYAMGDFVVVSRTEIPGLSPFDTTGPAAPDRGMRLAGRLLPLVMGEGWGVVEGTWGAWSNRNPATLVIPAGLMGDGEVTFTATPLTVMAGLPSTLTVSCPDGTEARAAEGNRYTCAVDGTAPSVIELAIDEIRTPRDLGINADARRLGVALSEVELTWD
jgi:hypothetical protein